MTGHCWRMTVSNRKEREARKAYLLSQIQQQRLDLSAGRRDWLELTQVYDRKWAMLLSLRTWALAGSGVFAVWGLRQPNRTGSLGSARVQSLERMAAGENDATLI